MRFIVRIIDYHFGGHIFYIRLIEEGGYKLEPDRKHATVFNSANEFAIIRDSISVNENREVALENVIDSEFLQALKRI